MERGIIFDRKLTAEGLNGLWLRGVVSEEQGERQSFGIMRIALVLLPVLVVIASAGGYFIAGRTLNPIQKIAGTARKIGEQAGAKIIIGRRVLYSVEKVKNYLSYLEE